MKSGMVAMIGRSNVGKSTLLNALVGSKIAITSPKPQTTRAAIQGVLTRPEGQIVFVDTPGIFHGTRDALSGPLTAAATAALEDIDAVLYVCDPTRSIGEEERRVLSILAPLTIPKLLVINKMDDHEALRNVASYRDLAPKFDAFAEISAKTGKDVDTVPRWLFERLPEGEFLYPEFQLTNMSNTEWLAEMIREKLFLRLREEVPYSIHVEVNEIATRENGTVYVNATIFTNSARYKPMIVGRGGQGIKEIGQSVRRELETVTGKKYYLELTVEVNPHWEEKFTG